MCLFKLWLIYGLLVLLFHDIKKFINGKALFIQKVTFEPLKKTIKEVGNITKAATFKSILHLSHKNPITFFMIVPFNIFCEKKIKQWFLGVTQKYELHVSFEALLRLP